MVPKPRGHVLRWRDERHDNLDGGTADRHTAICYSVLRADRPASGSAKSERTAKLRQQCSASAVRCAEGPSTGLHSRRDSSTVFRLSHERARIVALAETVTPQA